MPITCTNLTQQSGNHGRENNSNQTNIPGVAQMTPQPSNRAFTPPASIPVKKTPSIKDVISEPETPVKTTPEPERLPESVATSVNTVEETEPPVPHEEIPVVHEKKVEEPISEEKEKKEREETPEVTEEVAIVSEIPGNEPDEENRIIRTEDDEFLSDPEDDREEEPEDHDVEITAGSNVMSPSSSFDPVTIPATPEEKKEEPAQEELPDFNKHWTDMLEVVFEKDPTILFPLKGYFPVLEGNNLYVKVKNEIQKEHFLAQKKEVLSYFQGNSKLEIEDVFVDVDATLEGKKIIYDAKDKLKNLKESNPDLTEFMDILKLKISD